MSDKSNSGERYIEAVERAMMAIRRSQNRRTLARLASQCQERGAPRGGRRAALAWSGSDAAFEVLDAIEAGEHAGTPVSVSDVAAALSIDQPRASKLVAALVQAGLVRREADQADGRRALLVRTEAGRAVTEEAHRFRRAIFATAMSGWSDADRADFARLLTRFVDGLARLTVQGAIMLASR